MKIGSHRVGRDGTPAQGRIDPHCDEDRDRLLAALDGRSLTMKELRDRGVQRPGEVIYELELEGIEVERVRTSGCPAYRLTATPPGGEHHTGSPG